MYILSRTTHVKTYILNMQLHTTVFVQVVQCPHLPTTVALVLGQQECSR